MKRFALFCGLVCCVANVDATRGNSLSGRFEVGADWIYWKPFQDNIAYCVDVNQQANRDAATIESKVFGPNFNVSSGFKVYSNYLFSNCGWQIGGIYTNLYSSAKRSDSINPDDFDAHAFELNSFTFPILLSLTNNNFVFTDLASSWNSNYNCFDLDVSRRMSVCSNFDITLHSGLRGMWTTQKLHLDGATPLSNHTTFLSTFKQRFEGYGLEAGLKAYWNLGYQLSLTAQLGTSLLYARIKMDETLHVAYGTGGTLDSHEAGAIWHLSPTIDSFLGLQYQGCINRFAFNVHVGWEKHLIMSYNTLSVGAITNFTLQGLTLGGSITF